MVDLGPELIEYVFSLVFTTGATFAVVLADERRLARVAPPRLERAWPPASRASAAVAFGPLCLPVHFWRTRRSLAGALAGLGWAAAVIGVDVLVTSAIDAAMG